MSANELNDEKSFNLVEIQKRLAGKDGERQWRSLEELAESEEFFEFLHEEFPRQAAAVNHLSRRDFLKFLAAPLALAGLSACVPQPVEKIVPYVEAPQNVTPGRPLFFSTAMEMQGYGYGLGLLAESNEGRPTKLEGNPLHPASLGATDIFAQGSVLDLYDPDRAQVITNNGDISTWNAFLAIINEALSAQSGQQGAGLRILTGPVTSPTLASQLESLLSQFPQAKWHQYSAVGRDNVRLGASLAFGEPVETYYRFDQAQVILSLDADFMLREPGRVRYIRDFTDQRRISGADGEMNRLYVVESTLTNTGAMADHRLPLQAARVVDFTRAVAQELGVTSGSPVDSPPVPQAWIQAVAADLKQHGGSSLVIAGEQQPPEVHALAHAINQSLGSVGNTVVFTEPVVAKPVNQTESLQNLAQDLEAGAVEILVVLGENPVYTAPVDLNFAERYQKAGLSVYLSAYTDETAQLSTWHIPVTHFLEMWGDLRAYDGTVSLIQPLIEPLYNGKSPHELLAVFLGQADASGYDIVRQYWQDRLGDGNFESLWKQALHDGVIEGTALEPKQVSLSLDPNSLSAVSNPSPAGDGSNLEIIFAPDPSIWDGSYANNGWLQELPKPFSKVTWDNPARISPRTAARLGLNNGDVVELKYSQRSLQAPVWILPGQPQDSVTVFLGYGRKSGGELVTGRGFNAYALRTSQSAWFDNGLEISKTGQSYPLATTQHHHSMEGRDLVKVASLEAYRQNPNFVQEGEHLPEELPSMYPAFPYEGHQWGMSINLNACVGCNACVIACQSENNIAVVGKQQVMDGHEMHWLSIDSYYQGQLDNPQVYFQPVPCMHCENAPCEPVCPVEATVHDAQGLNEMIYNRCVGTRYCSNNCPYKVRRFNFLQYVDEDVIPLKLMRNPEVTVRSRGVMEKCTYCVQRIQAKTIEAAVEGHALQDGAIQTACQQACPANAIVFGDVNDENSQVSLLKAEPRDYTLLEHLGTRPRTTYLARLRNPNPAIEALSNS